MEVDVKLEIQESTPSLDLGIDSHQPLSLKTSTVTQTIADTDYTRLFNKPSIEGVELVGDKGFDELGLRGSANVAVSHGEISVSELTSAQLATILTDD